MSSVSIEVKGLEALVRKLGAGAVPIIRALTRAISEEVKAEVAQYPGPVRRPFRFASKKSAAFYRAMRSRAGLGPYVRNSDPYSQRLGPSWATEHRGSIDAAVGTRVTYAPWVQDAKRQQPGHKATGWVTDEEAGRKVEQSGVAERLLDDITSKW
ncbi:MAG TPA: hypothetical protein VM537_24280 [Anaerolineae bacterium]|nr:hypothetical protein [Anaerolineae bacterium]